MISASLIQKYNVPGPRYTSFPAVPFWSDDTFGLQRWRDEFVQTTTSDPHLSMYIHLPFCEKLCTFCGCHKRITTRHEVEDPYIQYVHREWAMYTDMLDQDIYLSDMHLGGGTPTFFSPRNLSRLLDGLFEHGRVRRPDSVQYSFEGHPNNTRPDHLQLLFEKGFRRVSFGVQDYNLKIQNAIIRVQPYENVKMVTETARSIGYRSVGHDLIFGLPFQTLEDIRVSMDKTATLMPDRISFYSYAHVPWVKGTGQRGFRDEDVPKNEAKRDLYEYGKQRLLDMGYHEIGFDHFALPDDDLYRAAMSGKLHRNFMGYTEIDSTLMIGLGISAISDLWSAYGQNEKKLEDYYRRIDQNEWPLYRGHFLTDEERVVRRHILNLTCRLRTSWKTDNMLPPDLSMILKDLQEMEQDGLVEISHDGIIITEKGRPFIRNVCMAFDFHLRNREPGKKIFSMTV
ncbi:MAG TPA: oxygen-independent coproporphyrinogen III oxidase [Membranihabitans sp.]|nr:oxygen-independent coproporphyrinogen III oxidase [Membranihabitans sp.]